MMVLDRGREQITSRMIILDGIRTLTGIEEVSRIQMQTPTSLLPVVEEAEGETETMYLQEWESIRRTILGRKDQAMQATDMSPMAKKTSKKNKNSQTLMEQSLRILTIVERMIKTSTGQEVVLTSLTIIKDQLDEAEVQATQAGAIGVTRKTKTSQTLMDHSWNVAQVEVEALGSLSIRGIQ